MRILSIGNFGHGWDGSICDEEHIASALEELGHEVTRIQRNNTLAFYRPEMWDMTLIAQWDGYKELIGLPHPIIYWAFDYQADGQEWHERLVAEADLYLSKRIADSKYPNWQWLSQDFAPKFLDRINSTVKDIDVLFTGSYLPWATERNETLKAVDEKFNLVIHSVNEWPGFKDQRGPIMDEGLPELYVRAKVILSIDHTLEAGYWSDRNAQIMACGRMPICRYVPLMEARFPFIEFFYDIPSCFKKIEAYLKEDPITGNEPTLFEEHAYIYAQQHLKVITRAGDLIKIVKSIL